MRNDPPRLGWVFVALVATLAVVMLGLVTVHFSPAHGRDLEGRCVNSPLKPWFDSLKSRKGLCCSDADGAVLKDSDWDVKDGHYRVRLPYDGKTLLPDPRLVEAAGSRVHYEWVDVPDEAVIEEPNKFGPTMVWAVGGEPGSIRCFMPGAMI